MYKKLINPMTKQLADTILHIESNSYIPTDPANTDYQQYLAWCAEGNEPLPADEGESN